MTAATRGQPHRWPLWLHHRQVPITLAVAAAVAVSSFVAHSVGVVLAVVAMAGIVCTDFASWRHQAVLCERCAADMPVNGDELAERRRLLLRWHHAPVWRLLVLVGIIAIPGKSAPWEQIGSVALAAFLVSVAVAAGAHLPVSLWCPWCSDGGWDDGDSEVAPTPDPTGAVEVS